ncbi:hypothetical protein [Thermoplasma sp.]|uniref:hypothetical protein n=1 Tax=Thermoplasma sp. TaxID=1973142 RepID=UPI00127038A9|nr:hypothetical protein [Thermoplasma sp.]KAA8922246.1 MAG: hypothetical protein F6Q11_05460 [Thermoplasma sp.]
METGGHAQFASVVALANMGFGFMLFLDGFIYTGIVPLNDSLGMLVFNLFWIVGIGYFIAGIVEVRNGQIQTGFVVLAYSLFGFILWSVYFFSYGMRLFYPPTPTDLLVFWIFWMFISVLSGVLLHPLGRMFEINLYWLAVTFALFAAAGYGNLLVEFVAGVVSFLQGFYNWYLTSATVVNTVYKKLLLPLR